MESERDRRRAGGFRAYGRFPRITAWLARLAAIGQGMRSELAPDDALDIARDAMPKAPGGIDPHDPLEIKSGTRVVISPADYAEVNIEGELVATTVRSMSILRNDPRVGDVVVHFPKIGYRIGKA